jgi:hypothetical protein
MALPALEGLVFDDRDNPMVAVHTKRGSTRYRYYVSRPKLTGKGEAGSLHRISAGVLEQFLIERLGQIVASTWRHDLEGLERIALALQRIILSEGQIVVRLTSSAISAHAGELTEVTEIGDGVCSVRLAFHMRRRQGAIILESGEPAPSRAAKVDRPLVRAIVLARVWAAQLESGEVESVKALARLNGLCHHYTARLLPLAYIAPDLSEAILRGAQPRAASLAGLAARPLPLEWSEQRRVFSAQGA